MKKLHEAIYNDFIAINKQDSNFTFWLITQKRQRFNQGGGINKGYINVGVVKFGSNSKLQLVGFHFPVENGILDQCTLLVENRKHNEDIVKLASKAGVAQTVAQDFLSYIRQKADDINTQFLNSTPQGIKGAYDEFWKHVVSYDNEKGTKFYDCLKIDGTTFKKKFTVNNEKIVELSHQPVIAEEHVEDSQLSPNNSAMSLNQILYGPPGTGKTYNTVSLAVDILEPGIPDWKTKKTRFDEYIKDGRIVFTTFHQSMSYEDFVEGIKPDVNNGQIVYSVKSGIFKSLCERAEKDIQNAYVMIIDEINRGNVSQIFGELITLLEEDKRLGNEAELKVKMPYSHSQKEFGVPKNLYIIGTMNTADRSVEALDSALRRRFCFTEMMPRPELLTETIDGIALRDVLGIINRCIVVLKDREHQIGHSYFINVKDKLSLKGVFKNNIIPLLQEYFYGNYDYIRLILGDSFVKQSEPITFACESETDVDATQYRLLTEDEWKKLDIVASIRNCLPKAQ
jgi:5-methylcytosine-specific restriction protein B